jgi:hypothetical protein
MQAKKVSNGLMNRDPFGLLDAQILTAGRKFGVSSTASWSFHRQFSSASGAIMPIPWPAATSDILISVLGISIATSKGSRAL